MIEALLKPFSEIVTMPPQQWHPFLVHFPVAFLVTEAALLGWWRITRKAECARLSYGFLHASLWTMLVAACAGVHDVGLDLGSGNPFWLGLQDRWANAFRWQSSVTVHSTLMLGLAALTAARLLWRKLSGPEALRGAQGWAFCLATLLGLWVLIAAAYVGALLSHK
ncbi:MAG TPA: hypothetical protein PKM57_15725 [Kiritimatiellia bacterium]|nr:hypothetical protein [Kiritimatiellia bacterium]HPS09367.1 hypothetical protein [Kiritimatiellia bacterium]